MPVTIRELGVSRAISENKDSSAEATLRYHAEGSFEVSDIETALIAEAPSTFRALAMDSYDISVSNDLGNAWLAEVKYSKEAMAPGAYQISFSTIGGSVTITQALATQQFPGGTITEYGGINVDNDGTPQGVDIVIPVLNLTVRAKISAAYSTNAYLNTLTQLTGTINQAPFLGWAANEVLFLGVEGDFVPLKDTIMSFQFAVSQNVTGLTLGSISGIAKKGHDYLWVKYEKLPENSARGLVPKAKAVFVQRIYQESNFGLLSIGVV